eukprot:6179540-Pleurochrysis_carterae.AAC.5
MAATSAMSSSVAMLLRCSVSCGSGSKEKAPWQWPPTPIVWPSASAFAASIDTNSVGTAHGVLDGFTGVTTEASGVQFLCESRCCQRSSCLRVKAKVLTSAVGLGSPRKWWYKPCIQEG